MSKGGRYLQKKPAGGRKKGVLIAILSVVLALAIIVGAGLWFFNSKLNLINRPEPEIKNPSQEEIDSILSYVPEDSIVDGPVTVVDETEATTEATEAPTTEPVEDPGAYDPGKLGKIVNVMVVGQAWRVGEDGKMSDSMILFTVNKQTKTLTLTSFLRDTYVKLANFKDSAGRQHTCGKQRLNTAYALGYSWGGAYDAMGMLNQTIEENFLIDIDYNVEIDFDTFTKIIDTLGGVEIELTADEAVYLTDNAFCAGSFTEGLNLLKGDAALSYARIRKANPTDNDEKRSLRQKLVIEKIVGKLKAMSLSDLNNLIDTILPMITTNMSNEDMTNCIVELLPLLPKLQLQSHQVPLEGTSCGQIVEIYGVNSGVLVPNLVKNQEALKAICEDND